METLKNVLEKNKSHYLDLLKGLVAADTRVVGHGIEGGSEINGQKYLEEVLASMGAKIEKDPLCEETIQRGIKEHNEGNPNHNYENRYNLIGTFKGNPGGRSLIFNGHVDTMPTGDLDKWESGPFTPTVKGNELFGLGTSDMKGGIMASICAVQLLKEAGIELPGDVKIMSVVDEEGGGNGSLSAILNGFSGDAVVIGEPTNCTAITNTMGFVFFEVEVSGISLHSSYKWLGVNAIEKALLLIEALREMEREWLMEYKHPELPSPTLNIGVIEGGVAGSAVPDKCIFKLCLHYIPNTITHEEVIERVKEVITVRAEGDRWLREHPPKIELYQAGKGYELDRKSEYMGVVFEAMKKVLGDSAAMDISGTGNDARLFSNIAKIPTVLLGPGYRGKGHKPNECLSIDYYYNIILIYANLILDWCSGKKNL